MRALLAFALLAVAAAIHCEDGTVRVLVTLPLDDKPTQISATLTDHETGAVFATLTFMASQANTVFSKDYCIAFGRCVTLNVTSDDGSIEYNEELNGGYYGIAVDTYEGWKDLVTGNVAWEWSPYILSGCFDPCSGVDCVHGYCHSDSGWWSGTCVCDEGYSGYLCDEVDCQALGQGSLDLWINSGYNRSFTVTHSIVGSGVDISSTNQAGDGWEYYHYCVLDGACVDIFVVASDSDALEGYGASYVDARGTYFKIWNSGDSYHYYDDSVSTAVCLSACGSVAPGLANCGAGSCVDTTNGSDSTSWECQCEEHYYGWECEHFACDSEGGFAVTLSDFQSLEGVSMVITRGGAVVASAELSADEISDGWAQRFFCMAADGATYILTVQTTSGDPVYGTVTFSYGGPAPYPDWWSADTLKVDAWSVLPIALELTLDPCSQWPCANGAYCNTTSVEEFAFTCECSADWFGDLCQYPTCAETNNTFAGIWFNTASTDNWELLSGDVSLASGTVYGSSEAFVCVHINACYNFYFMSSNDNPDATPSYSITLVTPYNWITVTEYTPAVFQAPTVTEFCTTPCDLAPEDCANGGSCTDIINEWQFEANCTCEDDWEGEYCTLPVCEDGKSRLVFAFNAFPTTTASLSLQNEFGVFPPFFSMDGTAVGDDYPVYDQDTFYTFCVPDDFSLIVEFVDTGDGFTYVHYQLSFAGEYLREPTDDKLYFSGYQADTYGAVVGSTGSNDEVDPTGSDSTGSSGSDDSTGDDTDDYTGAAAVASPAVAVLVVVLSALSVLLRH